MPTRHGVNFSKKGQYAPACQALANNNLPCGINPVHLKDSLCDIQSYGCDRCHRALHPTAVRFNFYKH